MSDAPILTAELLADLRSQVDQEGPWVLYLQSYDVLAALLAAAESAQQAKAELEGKPKEPNQPRARLTVFDRIPAERKAQLRAIGDLDTALTNALETDPAGARRMIERHLERAALDTPSADPNVAEPADVARKEP